MSKLWICGGCLNEDYGLGFIEFHAWPWEPADVIKFRVFASPEFGYTQFVHVTRQLYGTSHKGGIKVKNLLLPGTIVHPCGV